MLFGQANADDRQLIVAFFILLSERNEFEQRQDVRKTFNNI